MLFNSIIGQESIKKRLIQSANDGRISHAQMLYGPPGIGALALALAYAQYISCENRSPQDSCGTCKSCKQIQSLQHPDLHFSYPYLYIERKKETSESYIEEWRTMLMESRYLNLAQWRDQIKGESKALKMTVKEAERIQKKLSLTSFSGGYKFMLIWLPELMNIDTQNKLLKTLEEPPEHTLFLLVSQNPDLLLPTVRSRTQMIKVPKLTDEEVRSGLISHQGVTDNNVIEQLTQMADGDYHKALHTLKTDFEGSFFQLFVDWMRACYSRDVRALRNWSDEVHGSGRENAKAFLHYALYMMRQCIAGNYSGGELSRFGPKEMAFAEKFSPFINDSNIIELNSLVNEAHRDISQNVYSKLALMDMSLKVHRLLRQKVTA